MIRIQEQVEGPLKTYTIKCKACNKFSVLAQEEFKSRWSWCQCTHCNSLILGITVDIIHNNKNKLNYHINKGDST